MAICSNSFIRRDHIIRPSLVAYMQSLLQLFFGDVSLPSAGGLLQGNVAAGKKMRKQSAEIGTTEQRMRRLLFVSGFQQKEHGQHHHGHMMPGQPASDLIMIHPGCCSGILEGPLNNRSLPLHAGEPLRGGLCWGIGRRYLMVFGESVARLTTRCHWRTACF